MTLLSTRHRKRARQFAAGAIAMLCLIAALPVWARWLLLVPALATVIVAPVLLRGARTSLSGLVPRRARIEARKPYLDPRTGEEVKPARPAVPAWLRQTVYKSDRYRCVWCHRRVKDGITLQLDHLVPYSMGGLDSLWNFFTLCNEHNQIKSNYWKTDRGKVYYKPFRHAANMGLAGRIARREARVRLYPWRWLRAGKAYWLRKGR